MNAQPPPPPPPPAGQPGVPPPPPRPLNPPPPYIPSSQLRPSRTWFWVAGAIGVICAALSVVLFISFFSSLVDDLTGPLTEFRAPGRVTVELEAGAERTIYRQQRDDGRPIPGADGRAPTCTVTRADGGLVDVNDTLFPWTLKRNSDRYEALYNFTASEAGSYEVACDPRDENLPALPLAVGESIGFWDLITKGAGALALFFGGLIVAGAIAIITAVMRDNHKKRLQREAMQRPVEAPRAAPPPPPPA